MVRWVLALTILAAPAFADEGPSHHYYHHHHHHHLPPERHVVEVVRPPYSGNFIINGYHFTAKHHTCKSWVAGDRIKLIDGDWHAQCDEAVFYNLTQGSSCEMWCGRRAYPGGW
jgi:hypothetical protein